MKKSQAKAIKDLNLGEAEKELVRRQLLGCLLQNPNLVNNERDLISKVLDVTTPTSRPNRKRKRDKPIDEVDELQKTYSQLMIASSETGDSTFPRTSSTPEVFGSNHGSVSGSTSGNAQPSTSSAAAATSTTVVLADQYINTNRCHGHGIEFYYIFPSQLTIPMKGQQKTCRVFTDKQLWTLEAAFKVAKFPDRQLKEEIVETVNLSHAAVRIWFSNRRARFRNEGEILVKSHCEYMMEYHAWLAKIRTRSKLICTSIGINSNKKPPDSMIGMVNFLLDGHDFSVFGSPAANTYSLLPPVSDLAAAFASVFLSDEVLSLSGVEAKNRASIIFSYLERLGAIGSDSSVRSEDSDHAEIAKGFDPNNKVSFGKEEDDDNEQNFSNLAINNIASSSLMSNEHEYAQIPPVEALLLDQLNQQRMFSSIETATTGSHELAASSSSPSADERYLMMLGAYTTATTPSFVDGWTFGTLDSTDFTSGTSAGGAAEGNNVDAIETSGTCSGFAIAAAPRQVSSFPHHHHHHCDHHHHHHYHYFGQVGRINEEEEEEEEADDVESPVALTSNK